MKKQAVTTSRWQTLKKLVFFQLKLTFDALRDLLLSPVSVLCFLLDFIFGTTNAGTFDRLMAFGRQTDRWINLFGQHDAPPTQQPSASTQSKPAAPLAVTNPNADHWFEQIDTLLQEQQRLGGMSTGARAALDGYLAKLPSKDALDTPSGSEPQVR